jgi:pyruvate dehydrogenase E2 component (dihydrolipoamide acetyltransferase)
MREFRMPALGADMDSGTLVEWRVRPGDTVKRGDIVAAVETQKGIIDIEIFAGGTIRELLVQPGEEVPVGALLATLQEAGEAVTQPVTPPSKAPPVTPQVKAPAAAPAVPPPVVEPAAAPPVTPRAIEPAAAPAVPPPVIEPAVAPPAGRRLRVTPLARRRAAELGVDVAGLTGSGEDGAIVVADVEAAAAAKPATPTPAAPAPPAPAAAAAGMRQAIGAAMARSKREIPHYYLATTIDMLRTRDWLAVENARRPVPERLLAVVPVIKAVARALREVPELNGFWRNDGFEPAGGVHVGMAIALRQGGLIAPALRDADQRDLGDLMTAFRDLVRRARVGGLRSSELSDATVTLTSLGERGVETIFPVIYPPQVAIVGCGSVVERPWSVDGMLSSRPVMQVSLAADHRVSDGHRGAVFLRAVDRLLQQPEQL